MRRLGELRRELQFVFEAVTGIAGAVALWAAALDHEVLDDAVEYLSVVEFLLNQVDEIGDGEGRGGAVVFKEFDLDAPGARVKGHDRVGRPLVFFVVSGQRRACIRRRVIAARK